MSRTLEQAKQNAERLRLELPHLIQPSATDYDMVLLADALAAAERERDTLRRFVCALFDATDWPEGGDLDQFAFQDLAEKHGILSPLEVAEPCNVGCEETKACHCAEYGEFPQTCYRMADWLIAAREGS